ncbi:PEP-CTERM sorting domain-containing protein [Desulfobacterota bacterium M19]
MKKNYKTILTVLFFVGISSPVQATPYTGADIELHGTDFSSISGGTTCDISQHSYCWGAEDNTIYTNWGNLWVKYSAHLTPGNWNIGLNAVNYGDTLGPSGWYTFFNISSNLLFPSDDKTSALLHIPASATEINYAFFNLDIATAGDYTVTYSWTNDKYKSTEQDANIKIVSAFFDNTATSTPVPEPASILLFSTGLAGLAALKRNKRKRKAA